MAYIPRFKQSSKDNNRSSPKPESFHLELNEKMKIRPSVSSSMKIAYAHGSISRRFPIGLTGNNQFPSYVKLEPSDKQNTEENLFVLTNNRRIEGNTGQDLPERPWDLIAENILPDFKNAKKLTDSYDLVKIKPVARTGKVHFRGRWSSLVKHDIASNSPIDESELRKLRSFQARFKQSLKDNDRPSPKPESLHLELNEKMNIGPAVSSSMKIVYAHGSISRWFPIGLTGNNQFPSYVKLEPSKMQNIDENLLVLTNNRRIEGNTEQDLPERLWDLIAENILPDFKNAKKLMDSDDLIKIKLVARPGKVHFSGRWSSMVRHDIASNSPIEESELRKLRRSFQAIVSRSYNDNIARKFASKREFVCGEKNSFLVQLSDAKNPNNIISCKCREVAGSRSLQLGKIRLNDIRHRVVDISCLNKIQDLRLLLSSRRRLTNVTDEEEEGIRGIISAAVIDSDAKGELRWPIGKASFRNRFHVYSVWNVSAKTYKNSSFRVKLRSVERFHFTTSVGELKEEISVKLKGLVSELLIENSETDEILKSLKANLEFIWENFFCPELFSI